MDKTKKRVIIAVLSIITLWIIIGTTDFALVHNYRKPLFCVGVDLADDGGSGRYVGFGYAFEIEGNFMPDRKRPEVTSYKGFLFGKEVSRGFWDEMLAAPYKSMDELIDNAPSIQGTVAEVHENYMIIYIETSGYPYGADCSVSLNPVFGDSYTDVSVGDEVVVYYDGNIAESDPLQLGTVYAITLKTPANRVISDQLNVKEPPELIVVCGEEQITALRGTYSWMYKNKDGTETGIIADSAHPLECKDIMPVLSLSYSYKSSIDIFKAYFQFSIVPDEVEIHFWSTDYWNRPSKKANELAVQVDYVDGSYSANYNARLLEENCVYEVIAKWTSSEEYSGTAHYSFFTSYW